MRINTNSVARGIYAFFALALFGSTFILPIIFYRFPLEKTIYKNGALFLFHLPTPAIYYSLFIVFLWFLLVFVIMVWPSSIKTFVRVWPERLMIICFFLFSLIGTVCSLFHNLIIVAPVIKEIVYQLSLLLLAALVIGIYLIKKSNFKIFFEFIIYFVLFFDLCVFAIVPLLLGIVYPIIATSIILVFCIYYLKGFNAKTILFFIIFWGSLLLIVQPVKTTIRYYLLGPYRPISLKTFFGKRGLLKEASQVMKINNKHQAFSKLLQLEKAYDPDFDHLRFLTCLKQEHFIGLYVSATQLIYRLNHLNELTEVMLRTPKEIPYLYGKTYRPFLYLTIPRILWPDKPYDKTGQMFGHRYGMLCISDGTTSINLPIPIEGWINFGFFGVILSAAILSFSLRFIWLFFVGENGHVGNVVIGALVLYSAINSESSFFLVLGGCLHTVIVYWLLDIFVRLIGRRLKYQ
ncbi:MAG: hypothetical protein ABIH77_03790 [Pseudomonadota bacterium]